MRLLGKVSKYNTQTITRKLNLTRDGGAWTRKRPQEIVAEIKAHRLYTPELLAFVRVRVGALRSVSRKKHFSCEINEVDILKKYYVQKGVCALTSMPLTYQRSPSNEKHSVVRTNLSIDRIDSNLGYTRINTHIVCAIVNIMKNNMTMDEFRFWCSQVVLGNALDEASVAG